MQNNLIYIVIELTKNKLIYHKIDFMYSFVENIKNIINHL